jgi:hypothetical protein
MNTQKRLERYLRAAPKPPAPDGLLNRLKKDITPDEVKTRHSALRRWLIPAGGSISSWRVADTVAIAIVVLLSLSYGASRIIRIYHFELGSRWVNEDGSITATQTSVTLSGDFTDEEEAKRIWEETRELKKAGKYERTFLKEIEINGVKRRIYTYRYTLSNGRVMAFNEYE